MTTDAFTLLIVPACQAVVGGLVLGVVARVLVNGAAAVVAAGWGWAPTGEAWRFSDDELARTDRRS